jgi:hypothetical protein
LPVARVTGDRQSRPELGFVTASLATVGGALGTGLESDEPSEAGAKRS